MLKRQSLYFTAPYTVEIREESIPSPLADQLLVETIFSGISAGTELLLYRGQVPIDMAIDDTIEALTGTFRFPFKYGYAVVGRVIALGSAIDPSWQHQLVFAFNPHETHFLARPTTLLRIPAFVKSQMAVFLPNMETAVSFLMDGQPMIGEQVAVLGQGVVGLLTTCLLAQFPLASLITLDYYPLRQEWSRRLGATATASPTDKTELTTWLQKDRPYPGADLTYELSGNPQALATAVELTGFNGRVVIGSWYGQKSATLSLGEHFHRSHMQLISSQVSHINPQWRGRWQKDRRLQVAWQMLVKHQPERLITHQFPLAQATQAYQLLDQEPAQAIQVIFTY